MALTALFILMAVLLLKPTGVSGLFVIFDDAITAFGAAVAAFTNDS